MRLRQPARGRRGSWNLDGELTLESDFDFSIAEERIVVFGRRRAQGGLPRMREVTEL